jgi:3-oxoacyl-[acyl-carrier protein] reductase
MDKPITLITGTRKGIGLFLAEHFLKQGHIVIGCSRSESDFKHENYHHFCADVASEQDAKPIFKFIRRELGRLDNLINNAGIAAMNHTMLTPMSVVDDIFNTNVKGTFLYAREAARLMQKNKYGRIVNFSTVATPLQLEGEAIYAASKAAVVSLTQVMAREVAAFGITINSVGPTPVATDLVAGVPKEKMEALINRQAVVRYGTMEDVLNVIEFFIRKESDFITAQNIYLGGVV